MIAYDSYICYNLCWCGMFLWNFEEWQPEGCVTNWKVRMANRIAENTATLLRLALTFRPYTYVTIENPKSTMLFKLPAVASLLNEFAFVGILTYLGFFGMDLLKPTWLRTTMGLAMGVARKATKKQKAKFDERIARKRAKLLKQGKKLPIYYRTHSGASGKKQFSGGPNLPDTSTYPQAFCTAFYKLWRQAFSMASLRNAEQSSVGA